MDNEIIMVSILNPITGWAEEIEAVQDQEWEKVSIGSGIDVAIWRVERHYMGMRIRKHRRMSFSWARMQALSLSGHVVSYSPPRSLVSSLIMQSYMVTSGVRWLGRGFGLRG